MHSVEVVLDDAADRQVRAQWDALAAAGLPSQAKHNGPSNRPHITLALCDTISDDVQRRLREVVSVLPLPVTLGGLLLFGTARVVLTRLVVPSAALLDLQAGVVAALDDVVDPHGTFAAGRWTPHVTLGRRLRTSEISAAMDALNLEPTTAGLPIIGQLVRARRWDIQAKHEQWLDPDGQRDG